MLICRLLPLLLAVAWLPAQDARLSEREAAMEKRIRERAERGGGEKRELTEQEQKEMDAALEKLTPEERLARNVRHNASQFCRFVAAIKPQKLMPGQSGVMVVSALLNGQAVLPSPAPLEMISARQQGIVSLGELGFHPAELGSAAGYLGRPVYDNYAIFEIPVTIAADATIGAKQAVAVDLRFDIYDGFSAQPIGRFIDRVSTEVEVGKALDPAVQGASAPMPAATAAEPVSAAVAEQPAAGADAGGAATSERWISGRDPATLAEPAPRAPAPAPTVAYGDPMPVPEDTGMLPLPVWIGGGALLLVLVLMLARKK